jgi:hypothetical protein
MVRGGLVALIAGTAMTSAAMADCRVVNTTFRVQLNEQVTSTGVSTRGGACTTRLGAGASGVFTSTSIVARPAHGTLTQIDGSRFRYKPSAGFKGIDRYSFKVCGTNNAGSGCATLTYNITVE